MQLRIEDKVFRLNKFKEGLPFGDAEGVNDAVLLRIITGALLPEYCFYRFDFPSSTSIKNAELLDRVILFQLLCKFRPFLFFAISSQ